jgi:hypothetical protein
MEHRCSQRGSISSCCDITAESRIGDIRRRHDKFVVFVSQLIVLQDACVVGAGACAGLKEARFEPLLLIADTVKQAVFIAPLWTFSTRAVADGALQLSARLEGILLGHHCRIWDWRYSQAA